MLVAAKADPAKAKELHAELNAPRNAPPTGFAVGDAVELTGLETAAELNGQRGVVVGESDRGRWRVQLDRDMRVLCSCTIVNMTDLSWIAVKF